MVALKLTKLIWDCIVYVKITISQIKNRRFCNHEHSFKVLLKNLIKLESNLDLKHNYLENKFGCNSTFPVQIL